MPFHEAACPGRRLVGTCAAAIHSRRDVDGKHSLRRYTGRIANTTFGENLIPANADVPDLDVVFVGTPDTVSLSLSRVSARSPWSAFQPPSPTPCTTPPADASDRCRSPLNNCCKPDDHGQRLRLLPLRPVDRDQGDRVRTQLLHPLRRRAVRGGLAAMLAVLAGVWK